MEINTTITGPKEYERIPYREITEKYKHLEKERVYVVTIAGITYDGYVDGADASGVDEFDEDCSCLILRPYDNPALEIWIPWIVVSKITINKEDYV